MKAVIGVASGGVRNRGGRPPAADSERGRAEAAGFVELPASGYSGKAPKFPFPDATDRELAVWAEVWRSPQAVAWAGEPWRWPAVGMYVRVRVRSEDLDAGASLLAQLHRFADQVGMTPAGLRENGWTISQDVVAAKTDVAPVKRERRLRVVNE